MALPDGTVESLPTNAGVYLFKDRRGRVLYVGKAINLRARVRQYVAGQDERAMVPFLVHAAAAVEVVVVDSEKEALLLENTLIKKHRPRFNVKLRDDSNFLHLRLDVRQKWPRYTLVRRIKADGARYHGPYHSASKARQTLAALHRAFPLRTCTDAVLKTRRRPCLLYQMHRCVAPCVGYVDEAGYAELIEESRLMLEGRSAPLVRRLRERMGRAAEGEAFEEAARLRDLIRDIDRTLEKQKVVDPRLEDRDVWGLYREGFRGALTIVPVREGMMGEPRTTALDRLIGDDEELLSSLLNTAYPEGSYVPPEILVPVLPPDAEAIADVLSDRRGSKVVLRVPQRGPKSKLVELAEQNARIRHTQQGDAATRIRLALEELAEVLELPGPPRRIECFDNSNLQGTNPVAAMSVFIDGKPDRAEYRRYKVKTVEGADDYATMREVLERRLTRGAAENNLPDLLVVDGGKGQLGVAVAVLQDLGMHELPVIGISKPRTEHAAGDKTATDKLVTPDRRDPLRLPRNSPALRLIQHLRDEVHAHAVRYHRQVRGKNTLASLLEGIPGVGPARRKALLTTLGSARGVADASPEQLATVPGIGAELAAQIHAVFNPTA